SNQRVQAAITRAKAKKAAAVVTITQTELKNKINTGQIIENKREIKHQGNDVKFASKQASEVKMKDQADVNHSLHTADVSLQYQKQVITDSKQLKITTAVAKAKAKHEAQKIANSQDVPNPVPAAKVNSPQAKAKKSAQIEATSKKDKPS
ncbi:MAG: hypothetical protein QMC38_18705, partial [Sinobacterium sp.]